MVDSTAHPMVGYISALVAIICFGSNFVFAKGVALGDGVFFQFVMCVSIWITSIPVLLSVGSFPQNTSEFAFAMLGGFLWCTGNLMCGPIIQLIGLGMGILIWGSTNMLTGWASGTFGLFGLRAESVADPTMNIFGVVLAVLGLGLYLQVKPEETSSVVVRIREDYGAISEIDTPFNGEDRANNFADMNISQAHLDQKPYSVPEINHAIPQNTADPFQGISGVKRRTIGIGMAMFAGFFFGCSFDPSQYLIDREDDSVRESTLFFVFPQYCGILLSSFFYTCLYSAYKVYQKQEPYVHSSILVPGILSGLFWGIACTSWFIANQNLGFSISFPIITSGPGFIGALWGVFKYGEIRGQRNFILLGAAFAITLPALILVGLSH